MKVSEVLRLLNDDGWYLVTVRGSHRQLKHPEKVGRVTVAGKSRDDIAPWNAEQYSQTGRSQGVRNRCVTRLSLKRR